MVHSCHTYIIMVVIQSAKCNVTFVISTRRMQLHRSDGECLVRIGIKCDTMLTCKFVISLNSKSNLSKANTCNLDHFWNGILILKSTVLRRYWELEVHIFVRQKYKHLVEALLTVSWCASSAPRHPLCATYLLQSPVYRYVIVRS